MRAVACGVVAALLCAAASAQDASRPGPTVAFIAAMEHAGLTGGVRLAHARGQVTRAQLDCVLRTGPQLFVPAVAGFVEGELSPAERQDADRFFAGGFGIRLGANLVAAAAAGRPMAFDALFAGDADEDQREAAAFLESTAGEKN